MSYYASANGSFLLNEDTLPKDVLVTLNAVFDGVDVDRIGNVTIASVWKDSSNYNEEAVEDALETVSPFTDEGQVNFTGEDDAVWQFYFDKSTGNWQERAGTICYGAEDMKNVIGDTAFQAIQKALRNAERQNVFSDEELESLKGLLTGEFLVPSPVEKKEEKPELSAAETDPEEGTWETYGTCEWRVDSDGVFTLRPARGAAFGTLEDWMNRLPPWQEESVRMLIRKIQIEPGVRAKTCKRMFLDCKNLETADVNALDTSAVKDFYAMFGDCGKLIRLDISHIDTSSAVDMANMFSDCKALKVLDLSGFKTEKAEQLQYMFWGCTALKRIDIRNFTFDSAESVEFMFGHCKVLMELVLEDFSVPYTANTRGMFSDCLIQPKKTIRFST